ncbi:MAG: hypothetical protein HDT27_00365 [Subdoligranulum sp.]|nr:hypothetical protein [Subdoligranulum sp.]MBD5101155.1 hypothetical protein [Subdoligranulum sp.]
MNQVKNIFCKNILCAVLVLALCAGLLAGCSSDASASTSDSASVPDSTSVSAPTDDAPQDDAQAGEIIDFSAGLDEKGFIAGVTALDYVTLPEDYAAIPVPADEIAVSDEDIQEQIDGILAQFTEPEQITDRAVEDNEYVNIDYSGSIDGVKFDGGTASDQRVLSGSNEFIDDFLTQIIGHMPGETFDVVVSFPDPYKNNPDLAGKEAVFEVTINYIEGEDIVPEFDDAFVSESLSYYFGWETVGDARAEIEQTLYDDNLFNFVWAYMLENTQITEVPQAATDFISTMLLNQLRSDAQMYGITTEVYLQMMGGIQDEESFLALQAESIEESARQRLILQAIAEDAALSPDDDAIAAYFREEMDTEDYSEYEEMYGRPYLCMAILSDHANNLLVENAVIE